MPAISMVVLAGGASSRMGTDKSDLVWQGRTFLELQMEKGRQLGIQDILISGYRGQHSFDCPVVKDRMEGKGPLGGLEACFRRAAYDRCLVLGVDIPLVPVEELEKLIRFSFESDCPAVILQHGEKQEPLIGVYHTMLADAMVEEINIYKGSVFALLRRVGCGVYRSSAPEAVFANINRPEAYQTILERV